MKNNLEGQRFGHLVVIKEKGKAPDRHIIWQCRCDCGNIANVTSNALITGHTKSCGCFQKKRASDTNYKHGGSGNHSHIERLYRVWISMRKRCNNPHDKSYKYYGGRGIKVCEEWNNYAKFREWALSHGYNPTAKFGEKTIDRINCDDDYKPNNCRFVSIAEQNVNKHRAGYLNEVTE